VAQQMAVKNEAWDADGRTVRGTISYFGSAPEKPTFHAQDHARDNWAPDVRSVTFHDARTWSRPPTLEREGVCIAAHPTKIKNFEDREEVGAKYKGELEELIKGVTGASRVVGFRGGHMRFSQRTNRFKTGQNTQPAHFPHVDCTMKTAAGITESNPFGMKKEILKAGQRLVGYNVWRVVSQPPQDMPLSACDVRSVAWDDLVYADGVYDYGEKPWMRAEAYLVKYNPAHRWIYFSNMRPDEALIFRAYENDDHGYPGAPHVAFADPTCPPDAPGRISVESRVYAIFDE